MELDTDKIDQAVLALRFATGGSNGRRPEGELESRL
jgi:hypothetical protein